MALKASQSSQDHKLKMFTVLLNKKEAIISLLMATYYNLLEGTDTGGLMSDPVSIKRQTTAKNKQQVESRALKPIWHSGQTM